jgi:molecular chaperone DnaK (HSP70)
VSDPRGTFGDDSVAIGEAWSASPKPLTQPVANCGHIDHAACRDGACRDGAGRRRLREAAKKAEIGIVQFVHEPLAALYAYLRSQPDYRRRLAELDGCRILVFDWGGGTLDLTLCQVHRDQIVQIANVGDDEVGGDRFDELIRNQVRDAHARQNGIDDLSAQALQI